MFGCVCQLSVGRRAHSVARVLGRPGSEETEGHSGTGVRDKRAFPLSTCTCALQGEPSALESMQMQHHADRVKVVYKHDELRTDLYESTHRLAQMLATTAAQDWFQSLSHAQKSFVQQLKYKAKKVGACIGCRYAWVTWTHDVLNSFQ